MITTDQELQVTLERIAYFQRQVAQLRQVETNPANYHLSVSGYLAELDRMNLEVREYLWCHPSEMRSLVSFQQGHCRDSKNLVTVS
ncbi:MAG: hypothetical protein RBT80_25615 [Candidatus Vecturithrix sp.]|jgi:hypothetical protein|nr:hypothetical protein [Candidatus Vecturithrix sp.]